MQRGTQYIQNLEKLGNLANHKLELKKCIPEMVTTFLVLFNMGNYKKAPFTKGHQGVFNYSIDFYMICTKLC